MSDAGLLDEEKVQDVRGLFGCCDSIVEDGNQPSSFVGADRILLVPGSMLVNAQCSPEDQGDRSEMAHVDVGEGRLGLVPGRMEKHDGFCILRQAIVPDADMLGQAMYSR